MELVLLSVQKLCFSIAWRNAILLAVMSDGKSKFGISVGWGFCSFHAI